MPQFLLRDWPGWREAWIRTGAVVLGLWFLAGFPGKAAAQELRIAYTNTHRDFGHQLELAAQRCGVTATVEFIDTEQLTQEVLRRTSVDRCPDAVVMAADNLAKELLAFSPIPRDLLSPDISPRSLSLATRGGVLYGIPLIIGNHLMLFTNRASGRPAGGDLADFPAPAADRAAIVWNHASMYYFWPFILGRDGNPLEPDRVDMRTGGLEQALRDYLAVGRRLDLGEKMAGREALDRFVTGRAAALIDGDWSLGYLEGKLGRNLGISVLPTLEGHRPTTVCSAFVLAFPAQSLAGERKAALERLAMQLQSVEFQAAVWKVMRTLPANEQLLAAVRRSDDELLRRSLELFMASEPMPVDPRMQIVWEALKRGYDRAADGTYDAAKAVAYMQHLVDKTMRNDRNRAP